jgi:hypothetical protein
MKQKQMTKENSRRAFFGRGIAAGLALAIGLAPKKVKAQVKGETVKLLTPEGKLVEVEKKYLPPSKGKPISNQKLYDWMEKNKSR